MVQDAITGDFALEAVGGLPGGSMISLLKLPILYEKTFSFKLYSNEVYCTNALLILIMVMLCSEHHCRKVFYRNSFSIRFVVQIIGRLSFASSSLGSFVAGRNHGRLCAGSWRAGSRRPGATICDTVLLINLARSTVPQDRQLNILLFTSDSQQ